MFQVYDVMIIPLIIGIVEVFKRIGLPKKFSPLLSLTLGLLFGILYINAPLKEGVLVGLMLGLSASGLYSGTKNIVEKNSTEAISSDKMENESIYDNEEI